MKKRQHKKPKQSKKLVGIKHDSGKPMMSLLPADALEAAAEILTFGSKKYTSHNWRGGFVWSRVLDAALRHINTYNKGERKDKETGASHLAHALVNLMFLVEFERNDIGEDDLWQGYDTWD